MTYNGSPARTGHEKWILSCGVFTLPCHGQNRNALLADGFGKVSSVLNSFFSVSDESENHALSPVKCF